MMTSPFPALNRALWCVVWIALMSCGPAVWHGGIHAFLAWSPAGVRIVGVPPDSAAERAGLQLDDRIIAIDGRPIAGLSRDEVQRRLSGEVGSTVTLEVLRGDRELELFVAREPYAKPSTEAPVSRGY